MALNLGRRLVFPSAADSGENNNTEGSILIIALWILFLLSAFAVILGYEVRQKLTLVGRIEEKDKLRFVLEAGIRSTIAQIRKEESKSYYALVDPLSNNMGFKQIEIGDGAVDICYNYLDEQASPSATRYGISDEEAKININKIDLPVLERLFRIVLGYDEAEAQDLAVSIIDWRDSDSELSMPIGSGEDGYYRNLEYPYEAKDAEFQALDEILLVKGVTQDMFIKIKDYITIYGDGKVNINTAPKIVLLALGLDEDIANVVLSFRYGKDGILGTADDNVFENPSDIVLKLSQFHRFSPAELAQLSAISDQSLSTESENFMIRGIAKLNNRKNTAEVTCIVNRKGKILYWQES